MDWQMKETLRFLWQPMRTALSSGVFLADFRVKLSNTIKITRPSTLLPGTETLLPTNTTWTNLTRWELSLMITLILLSSRCWRYSQMTQAKQFLILLFSLQDGLSGRILSVLHTTIATQCLNSWEILLVLMTQKKRDLFLVRAHCTHVWVVTDLKLKSSRKLRTLHSSLCSSVRALWLSCLRLASWWS